MKYYNRDIFRSLDQFLNIFFEFVGWLVDTVDYVASFIVIVSYIDDDVVFVGFLVALNELGEVLEFEKTRSAFLLHLIVYERGLTSPLMYRNRGMAEEVELPTFALSCADILLDRRKNRCMQESESGGVAMVEERRKENP